MLTLAENEDSLNIEDVLNRSVSVLYAPDQEDKGQEVVREALNSSDGVHNSSIHSVLDESSIDIV